MIYCKKMKWIKLRFPSHKWVNTTSSIHALSCPVSYGNSNGISICAACLGHTITEVTRNSQQDLPNHDILLIWTWDDKLKTGITSVTSRAGVLCLWSLSLMCSMCRRYSLFAESCRTNSCQYVGWYLNDGIGPDLDLAEYIASDGKYIG